MLDALLRRSGRAPGINEVQAVILSVVDVEELFRLHESGIFVLVHIDVVVEMGFEAVPVTAFGSSILLEILQPSSDIIRIGERRLPAVGMVDRPAQGELDQLPVITADVIRQPDRRPGAGGWFRLDSDVLTLVVFTVEADVVLGPELLDQRDPLQHPAHPVAGFEAVEFAFNPAALLRHDPGASHQNRASFSQQVEAGPLVGQQHRITQWEAGHASRSHPHPFRASRNAGQQGDGLHSRFAKQAIANPDRCIDFGLVGDLSQLEHLLSRRHIEEYAAVWKRQAKFHRCSSRCLPVLTLRASLPGDRAFAFKGAGGLSIGGYLAGDRDVVGSQRESAVLDRDVFIGLQQ